MKSYLIKAVVLGCSYLSNLLPMNRAVDSFAGLLTPTLLSDILFFAASYVQFAMVSGRALYFLRERFMVIEIGINKAGAIFQHESLAVWFVDKADSTNYTFVIERTPSNRLNSSFPSGSPDGSKILETLRDAIQNMRPMSKDSDLLPLVSLPTSSESSNSESVSVPIPSYIPRMSLVDSITSSLAGAAAAATRPSQSSTPPNLAQDRVSGVSKLDPEQCIKRFKPQGLLLFDLILLAVVLHEEAPFYTLFRNQCYFFAIVLFNAIIQIYSLAPSPSTSLPSGFDLADTVDPGPDPIPAPTPAIGTPKDANILILPLDVHGEAGRCMGILVNDPVVLSTVVSIVMGKFKKRLRSQIDEVIFH